MEIAITIFLVMLSLALLVPAVMSLMMIYALVFGLFMYIKEEKLGWGKNDDKKIGR